MNTDKTLMKEIWQPTLVCIVVLGGIALMMCESSARENRRYKSQADILLRINPDIQKHYDVFYSDGSFNFWEVQDLRKLALEKDK